MDVAAALAVTALLAEAFGVVRRKFAGSAFAPVALGVVFGLMALVQMFNPIAPFDGMIVDLRNIPVVLAGAFLGWRGLIPCLAVGFATRYGIGGVGMTSGLLSMAIAGGAGLIWAQKIANHDMRNLPGMLLLGLMMSSHMLAAFALPAEMATWFFLNAAVPMLVLNVISVPLLAALLERENHRIQRENRLEAAATHDPVSGFLLGPAFMREVANSYAAKPFGTFAGFLNITPEPGIWRKAVGLFGEPAPVTLDRQALSAHLEFADLAGLCADGRVMVPLSRDEVKHISRVKAELGIAQRNTPSAAAGAVVDFSLIETRKPADFLRIADTAVVAANVDWKKEQAAHKRSIMQPDQPSRVTTASLFNPEEHSLLFAKAEFLIERKETYSA